MRVPAPAINWRAPQAEPSTLETDALPFIGQLNPIHDRRFMRQRGRMLSGLGDDVPSVFTVDPTDSTRGVPELPQHPSEDASGEIQFCEEEDDVVGSSGIFDSGGRSPNLNPNMGVFSQNYNVPGFISREKLFAKNNSLFDSPNGGDVIVIPGGGGFYVDKSSIEGEYSQPFGPPENRQAVPPSSFQPPSYWWPIDYPSVTTGPTLTNPFAPPPPPWFDQPGGEVMPATPPPAPGGTVVWTGPAARPHEGPVGTGRPAGTRPRGGDSYTGHTVGTRPGMPVSTFGPMTSGPRPAPGGAQPFRAKYDLFRVDQKLAGLGEDDASGPSTMTVVLTGALVGAGLAMIYSAYSKGK